MFGASSAIRFVCSHGMIPSSFPVIIRPGQRTSAITGPRSSSNAFSRASSGLSAPEWCSNVSRVRPGSPSQHSPKLNAPLTPATAFTRGSSPARGA